MTGEGVGGSFNLESVVVRVQVKRRREERKERREKKWVAVRVEKA